jgi:hypothetical protein
MNSAVLHVTGWHAHREDRASDVPIRGLNRSAVALHDLFRNRKAKAHVLALRIGWPVREEPIEHAIEMPLWNARPFVLDGEDDFVCESTQCDRDGRTVWREAQCIGDEVVERYATSVLGGLRKGASVVGALTGLYGFLYLLLRLEDYALLAGSIGLFVILAFVMFITRGMNWYDLRLGRGEA